MENLDQLQQMILEADKKRLENLARNLDLKANARETRRAASRAVRIAKGYETGV